jgi:hypothetical protein
VDTVYRVECDSCGPGVSYNPSTVSVTLCHGTFTSCSNLDVACDWVTDIFSSILSHH